MIDFILACKIRMHQGKFFPWGWLFSFYHPFIKRGKGEYVYQILPWSNFFTKEDLVSFLGHFLALQHSNLALSYAY